MLYISFIHRKKAGVRNEKMKTTIMIVMYEMEWEEVEKKTLTQLRIKKSSKKFKTVSKLELLKFSNNVTNRRTVAKKCQYLTTFPYGSNVYP